MGQFQMMDLNEVSSFIAIVQAGGLSRAAETTGLPKSTLSRQLQQLEKRLGVTLLQRTTRKINLTSAGLEYYKNCSQILNDLREAENAAITEQKNPQGILRVTAPSESGWTVLPPLIRQFREKYPEIHLDLDFTDRMVDLVGEGYDVALRAGKLQDSTLKSRHIAAQSFILVASAAYLKKNGTPTHPHDLTKHSLIAFSPRREAVTWELKGPSGKVKIPLKDELRTSSLASCRSLAQEGLGIALIPRFLVGGECGAHLGEVQVVLPQWSSERAGFSLVYPNQKYLAPKIRVFVDFFSEALRKLNW